MKNSIWHSLISKEEIDKHNEGTLTHLLRIECAQIGPNFLTMRMPIHAALMQPFGIMHGGASCVLAETVGSIAANYCIDRNQKICVGMEININHLRPVQSGVLEATAKPMHLGKTTQVWDIQIKNELDKLVAVSRLTVSVIDKK